MVCWMIFAEFDVIAYRVHDPKWAFAPTSGAGAATIIQHPFN
jgi:RES domain-containing protein